VKNLSEKERRDIVKKQGKKVGKRRYFARTWGVIVTSTTILLGRTRKLHRRLVKVTLMTGKQILFVSQGAQKGKGRGLE